MSVHDIFSSDEGKFRDPIWIQRFWACPNGRGNYALACLYECCQHITLGIRSSLNLILVGNRTTGDRARVTWANSS